MPGMFFKFVCCIGNSVFIMKNIIKTGFLLSSIKCSSGTLYNAKSQLHAMSSNKKMSHRCRRQLIERLEAKTQNIQK